MQLIRSDLDFILAQIVQAETNAPIADPSLPVGLAHGRRYQQQHRSTHASGPPTRFFRD